MRTLLLLIILTLLATVWLAAPAFAQWSTTPYGDLTIYAGPFSYNQVWLIPDPCQLGNGDFLVFYQVATAGNTYHVYLQLIDPQGAKQWGGDGIPISTADDSTQYGGHMIPDGQGGAFLVWWVARETGPDYELYGQHLGPEGQFLWDSAGVLLVTPGQDITWYEIDLCGDGEGGFYLAWSQEESATCSNSDPYLQRFDSLGQALWPQPAALCLYPDRDQVEPKVCLRERGGCFATWSDMRSGWYYTQARQKVTAEGQILWGPTGIYQNDAGTAQAQLQAHPAGGFLYLDGACIYHFGEEGQILWEVEIGGDMPGVSANQFAVSPSGRLYTPFFSDYFNTGDDDWDIFAQCLNFSGDHLWSPRYPLLAREPGDWQVEPLIALTPDGFLTAYEQPRHGLYHGNIFFQIADSLGQPQLNRHGAPLRISHREKQLKALIPDGTGGAIAFWEKTGSPYTLHANRILSDGSLGYPEPAPAVKREQQETAELSVGGNFVQVKLPQAGEVRAALYNLLGQQVKLIMDGGQEAGRHHYTIDTRGLASGVYFVRLQYQGEVRTTKIILSR